LANALGVEAEESVRRRVSQCRKQIEQLATNAGAPRPSISAIVENHQWHGYRLNPDTVRIVAISALAPPK
jgi:hypothetical protein